MDSASMPTAFGTAQHWRERAEETRAMAEGMSDADVREAMLRVAESYEYLAKRAEAREAGVTLTPHKDH